MTPEFILTHAAHWLLGLVAAGAALAVAPLAPGVEVILMGVLVSLVLTLILLSYLESREQAA